MDDGRNERRGCEAEEVSRSRMNNIQHKTKGWRRVRRGRSTCTEDLVYVCTYIHTYIHTYLPELQQQ